MDPQCDPFEAEMVLQREQVAKVRGGSDVIDVSRRESAVAPVEANDGALFGHRLVLFDETRMVPLVFEARQGRTGEGVQERRSVTEHRVGQRTPSAVWTYRIAGASTDEL